MSKKLRLLQGASLTVFSALCAAVGTVAWFVNNVVFPNLQLNGSTTGAYFAYGDGLPYEEDAEGNIIHQPYGITTQRHLYNLAWLQYNGAFNKDMDGDGVAEQYTFILDNSLKKDGLDMTGWIIPPIGTEDNPFIGTFEGNNVEIKNLTVSNQSSFVSSEQYPYGKRPTKIEYNVQPKIVGFFGVVGSLDPIVDGVGTVEVTDEEGVTSECTYDSSINMLKDVTLSNLKVESKTSQTLIGLAAGYVSGGLSNVLVDESSTLDLSNQASTALTSITGVTKLSHYGLVGYTKDTAIGGDYTKKISQYYNSALDTDGDDALWGGSVNMNKVFTRLKTMKSNAGNATAHPWVTYSNTIDEDRESSYQYGVTPQNGTNETYFRYSANTGSDYRGNFNYQNMDNTDKYYLIGGEYHTARKYYTSDFSGIFITDGSNHYLNASLGNTTATDTNTLDQTHYWEYVLDSGNNYYIRNYNDVNETWSYLRNNNGTLAVVTSTNSTRPNTATSWTVVGTGSNLNIHNQVGNTDYRLMYYNDTWTINRVDSPQSVVTGFTIRNSQAGNVYLRINGTTVTTGTSANATTFKRDENNYIYYEYNNQNYYLVTSSANSNNAYRDVTVNTTINTSNTATTNKPFIAENTSGSLVISSTTYRYSNTRTYRGYLSYDTTNAAFRSYNTRNTSTSYTVYLTAATESIDLSGYYLSNNLTDEAVNPIYDSSTSETYMKLTSENTTYFPLNVYEPGDEDTTNANLYQPKESNTGYIVSAATGNPSSNNNLKRSITFAYYPQTCIQNSLDFDATNKTVSIDDSTVKTISGNNAISTINPDSYEKYKSSKGKLERWLTDDAASATALGSKYIAGLHFTNTGSHGNVDKKNKFKATNVLVPNNEVEEGFSRYASGYELPAFCIDCKLKEQGYINFFSGIFNGTNGSGGTNINSFFSLHYVIRDSNNPKLIKDIKQITEIYGNVNEKGWSYAYKFSDNTYSKPFKYGVTEQGEIVKYELYEDQEGNPVVYEENNSLTSLNTYTSAPYNYTRIFQTSWISSSNSSIGSNNAHYLFYFEIPVNDGEYCLGNGAGSEGAYLVYLDIGANGSEVKDTIYSYNIYSRQEAVLFPIGVDFAANGVTGNGGDTICVYIASGKTGVVTFTLNDAKNVINISDTSAITTYAYKSIGGYCTLSGNSPGDMDPPEILVTRTCYLHLVPKDPEDPSTSPHDVKIVDVLTEVVGQGGVVTYTLVSSEYYIDGQKVVAGNTGTVLDVLFRTIPSLAATGLLDLIRDRDIVISLHMVNAKSIFEFEIELEDMPWVDSNGDIWETVPEFYQITYVEPNADIELTITSPEGVVIRVKINGTECNSGSTISYNP